ncbi:caspase family protein [Streptomyces collinus]|uniref:caspase family protein n=1 Tax=Streptomyces collinus TaxID=42684 RepID=UPI0036B1D73D
MNGYSVHIGLNEVDAAAYGGWNGRLSGCVNDALAMQRLAEQAGYHSTVLLDGQATSHAVIGEIARLAGQAMAGDICLISFSGHGSQVDDLGNDETDQQDETWVCYDRQVVDDELAQMWSQFEPGVRIVVISDSCHSGTVARYRAARQLRQAVLETHAREADLRTGSEAALTEVVPTDVLIAPGEPKAMPLGIQRADNTARRDTYRFVQALSGQQRAARATAAQVILLASCQESQLSYDGPVNGQFTGTLLSVWNNGAFTGDYRRLVRDISRHMLPDQTPHLDTIGDVDPAFLAQRPFTITPASGSPAASNPPGTGTGTGDGGGAMPDRPDTRPTIGRGATGEHVRYLQQRLLANGYTVAVDGVFGPTTEMTVRSFQRSQGLTADGVVGPKTWKALS